MFSEHKPYAGPVAISTWSTDGKRISSEEVSFGEMKSRLRNASVASTTPLPASSEKVRVRAEWHEWKANLNQKAQSQEKPAGRKKVGFKDGLDPKSIEYRADGETHYSY
jgi:hypothetical protein